MVSVKQLKNEVFDSINMLNTFGKSEEQIKALKNNVLEKHKEYILNGGCYSIEYFERLLPYYLVEGYCGY